MDSQGRPMWSPMTSSVHLSHPVKEYYMLHLWKECGVNLYIQAFELMLNTVQVATTPQVQNQFYPNQSHCRLRTMI